MLKSRVNHLRKFLTQGYQNKNIKKNDQTKIFSMCKVYLLLK
jgi:hypothetical protein